MKQLPMQEMQPVGTTKYRWRAQWSILLAAVLLAGVGLAYRTSWGSAALPRWQMLAAAAAGVAGCIVGAKLRPRYHAAWVLAVLPWPVVLALHGAGAAWRGGQLWMNGLIVRWNLAHDGGAALFSASASQQDVNAFSIVLALAMAQLVWWVVYHRSTFTTGVLCFVWLGVMIFGECYSPLACALLMAALLCIGMSPADVQLNLHTGSVCALLLAGLCGCAVLLPQGEMPRVQTLREDMQTAIRTARYGADTLPQGDLYAASTLQADTGEMLTVEEQQAKTLYLRGFVGGAYKDGVWTPLPESAFGGENRGLLKWLAAQGFDPLTQPALYWRLDDDTPEPNRVRITVSGAQRNYEYAPSTLIDTKAKDKNGEELLSTGLRGWDSYEYSEASDARPAELTVASPWVSAPQTDEQRAYSEAEAVYRRFVYDNYTTLDEETNALMLRLFWDDYETDSDGVYSAISRVRTVLKQQVSYDKNAADVPQGVDPVRYFLTESRVGNSMLYASATVQALRAHGIPARYVEGYYLPAGLVGDGTVTLTGQDAHAWAEVYFDGVGWLPLDTVPGCYYEAVILQQMVGTPDAVHKTAALQDNQNEAAQVTGEDAGAAADRTPLQQVKNLAALLLGIAAVALIVLSVALACAEVARGLQYRLALRAYAKAKPERRAEIVAKYLYRILALYGLQADLGWDTAALDEKVAARFCDVAPGEYSRVCALIEKTVYGGDAPDLREERAMCGFLGKLAASSREDSLLQRMKVRYRCL